MPDQTDVLKKRLTREFEITLAARIARAIELKHHRLIPNHHFAKASTECIDLYRDGYFLSTAMASQAVNEGIIRFVAERNGIEPNQDPNALVEAFEKAALFTDAVYGAMRRILGSFRNDFHHMNPSLATVDVQAIAKRNIADLAIVESEVFAHGFDNGRLVPRYRQYWDFGADESTEAYIRGY